MFISISLQLLIAVLKVIKFAIVRHNYLSFAKSCDTLGKGLSCMFLGIYHAQVTFQLL